MQLEIITPEAKVFKGEVDAVQFPGLDGSFQVLNGHAPIISALSKGSVKINLTGETKYEGMESMITPEAGNNKTVLVEIKGGIMEMLNNKVVVLAE